MSENWTLYQVLSFSGLVLFILLVLLAIGVI
jgi:hypothetical protein